MATLYLGDCLTVLPELRADAVITDPPYGINHARDRNSEKDGWVDYPAGGWDKERPAKAYFDAMLAVAKDQIIWGGNYFTDYLPPTMQWLVWDKGQREFSLADCEFAWSSQQKAARIFNYARGSALQEGKEHPTQKPVPVMSWSLTFVPKAQIVLDPFMGSGSTGVAAIKAGRRFVGIERASNLPDGGPPEPWRSELLILTDVLSRARETLLISIKGSPEDVQRSLGKLNLACKAHRDWQTERIKQYG